MSDALLEIHYHNTSNRAIAAFPVTRGVPLPEGRLRDADGLAIRLTDGSLRPMQTRVLETWFDGSIKWLLLDFALPVTPNERGSVSLVHAAVEPDRRMRLDETPDAVIVTTPMLRVVISKREFALFTSYQVNGKEMMLLGSDIVLEDMEGKQYYASLATALDVRVIEQGTQRIVVQVSGRHTAEDDATLLDYRVRYTFQPDEPGVKISYK